MALDDIIMSVGLLMFAIGVIYATLFYAIYNWYCIATILIISIIMIFGSGIYKLLQN